MTSEIMDEVFDADALVQSYREIRKTINFKYQAKLYGINLFPEVCEAQRRYQEGEIHFAKTAPFKVSDHGKTRLIKPVDFHDRTPIHSFCKNALEPRLRPKLIYDNCASLEGRGVSMARDRFCWHLEKYYQQYGTDGWVLFGDFSKFFDNIDHKVIKGLIYKAIPDEAVVEFLGMILEQYRVDGSGMTDQEYASCVDGVYNSLDFVDREHDPDNERYIDKSMGIGNEASQICGVFLPTPIDNYVKTVRRCKYYGRYMDDFYIMHPDKEFLLDVLAGIEKIAAELHLHLNMQKTRIERINRQHRYLKIRYQLTDTGKVIMRFDREVFTRERRKLKKFRRKLDAGEMEYRQIEEQYTSWRGNITRKRRKKSKNGKPIYHNRESLRNTDKLFNELFIKPFIEGSDTRYGKQDLHTDTRRRYRNHRPEAQRELLCGSN